MQIAFCFIAKHADDVEPIFPSVQVERSLASRGMRNGAERSGGICRDRRKKINKARRVVCTGNFFLLTFRFMCLSPGLISSQTTSVNVGIHGPGFLLRRLWLQCD